MKMAVFWVVAPCSLMMEAARTSETLVNFYQTTRCYNPEDSHLQFIAGVTAGMVRSGDEKTGRVRGKSLGNTTTTKDDFLQLFEMITKNICTMLTTSVCGNTGTKS
jgi:hypothetical protein